MRFLYSLLLTALIAAGTASAQTPAQLKAMLPAVPGWTISEETEVFGRNNLFDRINGAAPLYLENNFQEMTSMVYTWGDDYITIQAYRHATPEDTFGMYASERSSGMENLPYGGEAQGDDKNLYFFAGNIYVKMWSNSANDVAGAIRAIAEGFAKKIDADAGYPEMLERFPAGDKIEYSEAYITSSYIGHEFLKGVYTANYSIGGKRFQLFVIDAKTREAAKEMLDKYFTFSGQPLDFTEGDLVIKDRFNGDIPAVWKGRYIFGIFSESGSAVPGAAEKLKELVSNPELPTAR